MWPVGLRGFICVSVNEGVSVLTLFPVLKHLGSRFFFWCVIVLPPLLQFHTPWITLGRGDHCNLWPLTSGKSLYGLPEGVGFALAFGQHNPSVWAKWKCKETSSTMVSVTYQTRTKSRVVCLGCPTVVCYSFFFSLSCSLLFHSGFSNSQNTFSIYISLLVNYYC